MVGGLRCGFVAGLVLIGLSERKAFEFASENVAGKDVHYTPHITARLIEDGPGLSFLEENCPRNDLATCALYEALSWSDDPYRLTVSHIHFRTFARTRLVPPDDTRRSELPLPENSATFFFQVFADRPFNVLYAFV